jgi:hypothetical protein
MIDLKDTMATIGAHLVDGSPRALTYAVLECRLAIERICYGRLASHHDYISPEEVRRWQPHHVIRILEEDVDPHVVATYTLSISRQPVAGGEDLAALDYVPVGTQEGFDGRRISKLWNALSNAALHVSKPKSSAARLEQYGSAPEIRAKVEGALAEIERISKGTMTSTGFGPNVTFTCACGTLVRRRAELVPSGKIIFCINPDCSESFEVAHDGDDINFILRKIEMTCICGEARKFAMAPLEKLRMQETHNEKCACGAEHIFHWRLFHGIRRPE